MVLAKLGYKFYITSIGLLLCSQTFGVTQFELTKVSGDVSLWIEKDFIWKRLTKKRALPEGSMIRVRQTGEVYFELIDCQLTAQDKNCLQKKKLGKIGITKPSILRLSPNILRSLKYDKYRLKTYMATLPSETATVNPKPLLSFADGFLRNITMLINPEKLKDIDTMMFDKDVPRFQSAKKIRGKIFATLVLIDSFANELVQ